MTTPMYREIAEQLRHRIESGEFPSGAQMPTEQELQKQHSASRNTIRDAIKQLTTLGLVETRPGQGTFVVPKINPFVTPLTGPPETAVDYTSGVLGEVGEATASGIQVEIQEATDDVAGGLGLEPGTEVISRHRKRFINGVPWALETSFYPGEFADRGADKLRRARNIDEGTVSYLRNAIGVRQVGYRDWVTVRAPNATEAEFFKLAPDGRVAVYEMFRTAFDGNEQPMRLTVTIVRADRNQFIVDVGDVPELKSSDRTQRSLPITRGAYRRLIPGRHEEAGHF
jgi:GntR family transcriptional regulator